YTTSHEDGNGGVSVFNSPKMNLVYVAYYTTSQKAGNGGVVLATFDINGCVTH
ncbi:hypothetical protein KI387_010308, partial [Taxus chinensis]